MLREQRLAQEEWEAKRAQHKRKTEGPSNVIRTDPKAANYRSIYWLFCYYDECAIYYLSKIGSG
jgi:hypothetical protein